MLIFRKQKIKRKNYNFLITYFLNKLKDKQSLTKIIMLGFLFLLIVIVPHNLGLGLSEERFLKKGVAYITSKVFRNSNKPNIIDDMISYRGNFISIFKNYIGSHFYKAEIYEIDLSFENFNKLKKIRDTAIKNGILLRSNDDEVNAKLKYSGRVYPIKMRLKGDWTDHLVGNQWSFRIKVKKGDTINGLKEFSLQHPRTRGYINEYLYHKFLKNENLPYLRYEFIKLKINGKDLGIYAVEEHFTKLLIENSGFREGPILRLDENPLWMNWKKNIAIDKTNAIGINLFDEKNSQIKDFNSRTNNKVIGMNSQFQLAADLLDQFLSGNLKTSDVFDLKLTARYFAINDLLSANHSEVWHNLRFYFNPITGRLIPIGFDAHLPIRVSERSLAIDRNALNIFSDKRFISYYVDELERITNQKYLDSIITKYKKDFKNKLGIIHKSYPHIKIIKDEIYKNSRYIKSRLSTNNPLIVKQTYTGLNKNNIKLSIANSSKFPIEIIRIDTKNFSYVPSDKNSLDGHRHLSRIKQKDLSFVSIKNPLKEKDLNENQLNVIYRIINSETINSFISTTKPWRESTSIYDSIVNRKSNIFSFEFLDINKKEKSINIKKGNYIIEKPLIIPKGYKVIIEKGVNINFLNSGLIFSESSINFKGSIDSPIFIKGNGKGNSLIIANTAKSSKINHVTFDNLSAPKIQSLNITGAVNFYDSDVSITNSRFINSSAEDALNLFRSKFIITNTFFDNAFSDGLDSDFSQGIISNTSFSNLGNDGLDISGSKIEMYSIKFISINDKAISVGEKSKLKASKIQIQDSGIALASKDLSSININNIDIDNVDLCLAAFQKKSEYGPAYINLVGGNFKDCIKNYLLENGSNIILDKKRLLPNTIKVMDQLYGKKYGTKTVK